MIPFLAHNERLPKRANTIARKPKSTLPSSSLGRFLHDRVDPDIIAGQIVPGLGRRYQPDFRSERHRLIVG